MRRFHAQHRDYSGFSRDLNLAGAAEDAPGKRIQGNLGVRGIHDHWHGNQRGSNGHERYPNSLGYDHGRIQAAQ